MSDLREVGRGEVPSPRTMKGMWKLLRICLKPTRWLTTRWTGIICTSVKAPIRSHRGVRIIPSLLLVAGIRHMRSPASHRVTAPVILIEIVFVWVDDKGILSLVERSALTIIGWWGVSKIDWPVISRNV